LIFLAEAGPGAETKGESFNFLACSRTITSNMLVRLRFSSAAHLAHRSRTSGVIFSDVAAVLRSGSDMQSGGTRLYIAHLDIRYQSGGSGASG
jgi:hypothetical protein